MACGSDEIQAGVDSGVLVAAEGASDFQLLLEIFLKLGIEMVENGLVAVNEKANIKKKNLYSLYLQTAHESHWCPGYKLCTWSRMPDFHTSCQETPQIALDSGFVLSAFLFFFFFFFSLHVKQAFSL